MVLACQIPQCSHLIEAGNGQYSVSCAILAQTRAHVVLRPWCAQSSEKLHRRRSLAKRKASASKNGGAARWAAAGRCATTLVAPSSIMVLGAFTYTSSCLCCLGGCHPHYKHATILATARLRIAMCLPVRCYCLRQNPNEGLAVTARRHRDNVLVAH